MNLELDSLTGIRSGKRSYYREYVRSDERLHGTLRAMDAISQAVVRTVEGPRELLQEVVHAARSHLDADWALLLIAAGEFPGARPRCLMTTRDRGVDVGEDDLPLEVRREVEAVRAGAVPGDRAQCVRAPMMLEGRVVGTLSVRHRLREEPADADIAVLRILANQAAVSLHTSEQFQAGLLLHRRAQRLNAETEAQRRDLNERDTALRRAIEEFNAAVGEEIVLLRSEDRDAHRRLAVAFVACAQQHRARRRHRRRGADGDMTHAVEKIGDRRDDDLAPRLFEGHIAHGVAHAACARRPANSLTHARNPSGVRAMAA